MLGTLADKKGPNFVSVLVPVGANSEPVGYACVPESTKQGNGGKGVGTRPACTGPPKTDGPGELVLCVSATELPCG